MRADNGSLIVRESAHRRSAGATRCLVARTVRTSVALYTTARYSPIDVISVSGIPLELPAEADQLKLVAWTQRLGSQARSRRRRPRPSAATRLLRYATA